MRVGCLAAAAAICFIQTASADQLPRVTVPHSGESGREVHPFSLDFSDAGGTTRSIFQYLNGQLNTFGVYSTTFGSLYVTSLLTGATSWLVPFTVTTSGALASASANINFNATNTGNRSAIGANFVYRSTSSNVDKGFDVGEQHIAEFAPKSYSEAYSIFKDQHFYLSISPNDTAGHRWATIVGEWNIVNRGIDTGFMRDRSGGPSNTGGLLMVPESATFGYGGTGRNATFAYTLAHSGGPNADGKLVKFYTGYLLEPNSIAGRTGRGAYFTGDATGEPAQAPFAPMQVDGAWLHGFDTTLATFHDNTAVRLAGGQRICFSDRRPTSCVYWDDAASHLLIPSDVQAKSLRFAEGVDALSDDGTGPTLTTAHGMFHFGPTFNLEGKQPIQEGGVTVIDGARNGTFAQLGASGHIFGNGPRPAVEASAGTVVASAGLNDNHGSLAANAAAILTVTFALAYADAPDCIVSSPDGEKPRWTTSRGTEGTARLVIMTPRAETVTYICMGR